MRRGSLWGIATNEHPDRQADYQQGRNARFEKAPRELESEGAREALPAPPRPIDDPEVQKKIRAIAGNEAPLAFIARTGIAVSQIRTMSVDQILRRIEGEH
jgi:hypothetical protein